MASGSSAHASSGSKGFDFATDDILYSYEDYGNQDSSNGCNSDPAVGTNSSKDFNKSRLSRPTMYAAYSQPEDSVNQDMSAIVDRSMKKYVENIMRFLEGISSRLSQLDLYCYNLDKSIGEMRCDLTRDHGDADIKLKAVDKHIQEVHRSVQILRDKQELADTQKELAKLQLAQKETSPRGSQSSEDKSSAPPDASNKQLALALPHQVAPMPPASQGPPQNLPQQQTYYLQPTQLPNQPSATQIPQIQYIVADPQGRTSQMQDISRVAQPLVNQTPNMSPYPQYQQQWSQQLSQPVQPPPQQQQSLLPPQMRNQPPPVYSPYPSGQPTNPPPPQEILSSSMPMQMQYSGVQSPVTSRADPIPYGYGAPGRIVQQQPPSQQQQVKEAFGPQPGDAYATPPSSGYVVYEAERGRRQPHHLPQQGHFSQGVYPPPNGGPFQNLQSYPTGNLTRNNTSHPQFVRSNPLQRVDRQDGEYVFQG